MNIKHGFTKKSQPHKKRFYHVWGNILNRCNNHNFVQYKDYGGRGIKYDPRWDYFLEFKKDMYLKYLHAMKHKNIENPSIERIDVNGDYCKENCTWIPLSEQAKNRRDSICNGGIKNTLRGKTVKIVYGEFECKKCGKIFFQKHLLDAHKGKHVKESNGPPKCRVCREELKEGRNWMPSMVKASSRVCKRCMKIKNKTNYLNRKKKIMEARRREA